MRKAYSWQLWKVIGYFRNELFGVLVYVVEGDVEVNREFLFLVCIFHEEFPFNIFFLHSHFRDHILVVVFSPILRHKEIYSNRSG